MSTNENERSIPKPVKFSKWNRLEVPTSLKRIWGLRESAIALAENYPELSIVLAYALKLYDKHLEKTKHDNNLYVEISSILTLFRYRRCNKASFTYRCFSKIGIRQDEAQKATQSPSIDRILFGIDELFNAVQGIDVSKDTDVVFANDKLSKKEKKQILISSQRIRQDLFQNLNER